MTKLKRYVSTTLLKPMVFDFSLSWRKTFEHGVMANRPVPLSEEAAKKDGQADTGLESVYKVDP